jgi:hypothetical protein
VQDGWGRGIETVRTEQIENEFSTTQQESTRFRSFSFFPPLRRRPSIFNRGVVRVVKEGGNNMFLSSPDCNNNNNRNNNNNNRSNNNNNNNNNNIF